MLRAEVALVLALLSVGCEPERSLRWENPLAGMFAVDGYVLDQHGSGVNGVELKLTAPDGSERVGVTDNYVPWNESPGWFDTGFFSGPTGQYQLAIISAPPGYSVPATQPNPVTFQLNASTPVAKLSLTLHRN
jgi:hypothetical protein